MHSSHLRDLKLSLLITGLTAHHLSIQQSTKLTEPPDALCTSKQLDSLTETKHIGLSQAESFPESLWFIIPEIWCFSPRVGNNPGCGLNMRHKICSRSCTARKRLTHSSTDLGLHVTSSVCTCVCIYMHKYIHIHKFTKIKLIWIFVLTSVVMAFLWLFLSK